MQIASPSSPGARWIRACWTLLLLVVFPCAAYAAGQCTKVGSVCADASPSKLIGGVTVTLGDVGGCWRYTDTYSCVEQAPVNYCAGIAQISGCQQTGSVCTQYAGNGTCLSYTNTFRCGDAITPPSGVIRLDDTHTVVTDTIDRAQCASNESNPACKLAASVCTDPGGTRIVNGLPVTKDCWGWTQTHSCIAQNYKNYCIPLRQTPACHEVSNVCKSYAWNGTCNEYERKFSCDDKQGDPPPEGVVYLDSTYTIVKDALNTSQCDPNRANPNCTLAQRICTQPGGTRNINGLDVYKDCWEWSEESVCASTELTSDCADLTQNTSCTPNGSTCIDTLPGGQCGLLERKFECRVTEASSKEVTTCDNGVCINGDCSAPNTNPDTDFGRVIASLEAARQMGLYFDEDSGQLFKGTGDRCTVKLGGLVNCCKAKGGGGAQTNSAMMQGIMKIANEGVRFLGSPYMYDALYSTDLVPTWLLNSIYGPETILQSGSEFTFFGEGNFNFYGIKYVPGSSPPLAFDPASFAIAIAMQIITQYLQCDQSEQLLGMRKGQNLCTRVGSWCSTKILGACITKKEGYCCYNSRISRTINEQGRAQIGKGYGDPRSPDCSGFTVDDLQSLDFGKMDLSELVKDVVPKNLNETLLNERAQQTIQEKSKNYFEGGDYKP